MKHIRIAYSNFYEGFSAEDLFSFVLPDVVDLYDIEISSRPDFVIYGPYGGQLPPGDYVKIFYGCENVSPNMSECDWAFGVEYEDSFVHPRYCRLHWGKPDSRLLKPNFDDPTVTDRKRKFCNFLFAHRVPFREEFFKALSRYKRVDAPGKSMNNMAPFDARSAAGWQRSKIAFLANYKFTIAFENSSTPGYNTEKLTDPILAHSVPIYWGDPWIDREFDTGSFIDARKFVDPLPIKLPRMPYKREPYNPLRPRRTFPDRFAARVNNAVSRIESRIQSLGVFNRLVEQVIAADQNPEIYSSLMRRPHYLNNRFPNRSHYVARWRQILG